MSNTELMNTVHVSCSRCTPNGGILLNRYWHLVSVKNSKVSFAIAVVMKIPNLILDKVFPLQKPRIAKLIMTLFRPLKLFKLQTCKANIMCRFFHFHLHNSTWKCVMLMLPVVPQSVAQWLRLLLGNQRFPVRVQRLAMFRGELSAGIAQLTMSRCL